MCRIRFVVLVWMVGILSREYYMVFLIVEEVWLFFIVFFLELFSLCMEVNFEVRYLWGEESWCWRLGVDRGLGGLGYVGFCDIFGRGVVCMCGLFVVVFWLFVSNWELSDVYCFF